MDGVNLTDCSTCEHDTNEYSPRCVECMTTLKHHYQPKKEEIEKMFVELPDSGDRRDFCTGAVRDMGNKGRCDLLPWDVIGPLLDGDLYGYAAEDLDRFCNLMAQATHSPDQHTVHLLVEQFVGMAYTGSMTSALLEVAYHYEAGARKYSSRNWERGIPVHVFLDSAGRHFLKWLRQDKDEPHDRAVVWNLLGALWTIDHHPDMIKEEE